jgi:hypothetical protein
MHMCHNTIYQWGPLRALHTLLLPRVTCIRLKHQQGCPVLCVLQLHLHKLNPRYLYCVTEDVPRWRGRWCCLGDSANGMSLKFMFMVDWLPSL